MEKMPATGTASDSVINIFKNGRKPTKEEYTKFWIRLINQLEREKVSQP